MRVRTMTMTATTTTTTIQPHNVRSAEVWSTGGARYDDISRGVADAVDHCVVRFAPLPGERVLDLATGTGWTSRAMARRGARVTGCDIATGLLESARARAAAERLLIDYEIGDAEALPFASGVFDGIVSTFGVMFASRPEAAAAELARVCRPGGRIALTTWLPDSTPSRVFQMMQPYMPAATAPSPFEWGRTERIVELLGGAFDLRFEKGVSKYRELNAHAAWETAATSDGPTRALVSTLDATARAALERNFVAFHAGYPSRLGICVPREYWVTIGTRR